MSATGFDCTNYENVVVVVVVDFMLITVKCNNYQPKTYLAGYRLNTTDDNKTKVPGFTQSESQTTVM